MIARRGLPALVALMLGWMACGVSAQGADIIPTRTPLPLAISTATATAGPAPTDTVEWQQLAPGIDLQITQLPVNARLGSAEIVLLRAEPERIRLRMFYDPNNPSTVTGWQARTEAIATINGGFFHTSNLTNGLLVTDGNRSGTSFDRHGGMLSVVGDAISIRALAQFPYDPAEPLDQAVQGSPMVLYPGGFPVQFDDIKDVADRRTIVGQDRNGRLVFIVADYGIVSLYRVRDWLASERPDIDLFVAFNLDGGHSTGIVVNSPVHPISIDSRTPIPAVIAIYERK